MPDPITRVLKSEEGIFAREIIDDLHAQIHAGTIQPKWSSLLQYLSDHVYTARTRSGARIVDASDFHAWLRELAEEAEALAK